MSVQSRRIALSMLLILTAGCYDDSYMDAITRNNGETAPKPGDDSSIVIEHVSSTSLTVSWVPARDDRSSSDALAYRVFYGTTPVPAAIQGAQVVSHEITLGWTQALTRVTISGLSATTNYHIAVFVQDEDGNVSRYLTTSASTNALAFPQPGNSGILTRVISNGAYRLEWTAASDSDTPSEKLQYRVFYAAAAADLADYALASAQNELTAGWTENIISVSADKLISPIPETPWQVTVFVRDLNGQTSSYTIYSYPVDPIPDAPPVVTNPQLSRAIAGGAYYLVWSAAVDDLTPVEALQYRVFYSSDATTLTSFETAQYQREITLGWTVGITSVPASVLLTTISLQTVNVFVRDTNGSVSAYEPLLYQRVSPTNTSPVPGAAGLITVHNVAAKKIRIQWSAASDAETPASGLRYAVYYSPLTNLVATYDSARVYGAAATGWEPFSGDCTADNLSKATVYYLNVFVMDPDGAVSAYTPVMAETTSN
jgi:hypothetical protein